MQQTLQLASVELSDGGCQLFLGGHIGRKKLRFLIDTGASRTVFDEEALLKRFPDIYFHPGDVITVGFQDQLANSREVEIIGLKFGRILIATFDAIAVDLGYVNKTYSKFGLPPIHGIIGSELLIRHKAVMNFSRQTLCLKTLE